MKCVCWRTTLLSNDNGEESRQCVETNDSTTQVICKQKSIVKIVGVISVTLYAIACSATLSPCHLTEIVHMRCVIVFPLLQVVFWVLLLQLPGAFLDRGMREDESLSLSDRRPKKTS